MRQVSTRCADCELVKVTSLVYMSLPCITVAGWHLIQYAPLYVLTARLNKWVLVFIVFLKWVVKEQLPLCKRKLQCAHCAQAL